MRGYIERGVGHRIKDALWVSVLGLAIASGTALASGPDAKDLPAGSGSLGGPSGSTPPVVAPPRVDLPGGLPTQDVTEYLRDHDPVRAESADGPDENELQSLLKDYEGDLVKKDLQEAPSAGKGGKGGALPPLPGGSMENGGPCIVALLGDAGVNPGDRILQCIEKYGSHSPSHPPELSGNEFVLPASDCEEEEGTTDSVESAMDAAAKEAERKAKEARNQEQMVQALKIADESTGAKKEFFEYFAESVGMLGGAGMTFESGPGNSFVVTFAEGNLGGGTYLVSGGNVVKLEAGETKVYPPRKKSGGSNRPVEPGSGGCDPEGEKERARALADCIFAGTQIAGAAGPAPVSMNPMGSQGLPEECNGVDVTQFWGSSTGDAVTDPSPYAEPKGGPTIPKRIIRGDIDPMPPTF